jgi:hypothetical protein
VFVQAASASAASAADIHPDRRSKRLSPNAIT